jgi:hypothetical protein
VNATTASVPYIHGEIQRRLHYHLGQAATRDVVICIYVFRIAVLATMLQYRISK